MKVTSSDKKASHAPVVATITRPPPAIAHSAVYVYEYLLGQLNKEPQYKMDQKCIDKTTLSTLQCSPSAKLDCSMGLECLGLSPHVGRTKLASSVQLRALGNGRILMRRMTREEYKAFTITGQPPQKLARCTLCLRYLLTAWITFLELNSAFFEHDASFHCKHLGIDTTPLLEEYDKKFVLTTPSTIRPNAACSTVRPCLSALQWIEQPSASADWAIDQSALLAVKEK